MKKLVIIMITICLALVLKGQENLSKKDIFNQEVINNKKPNKEQWIFKKKYKREKRRHVIGIIGCVTGGFLIAGVSPNVIDVKVERQRIKTISGLISGIIGSAILISSNKSKKKIIQDYHDRQVLKEKLTDTIYELKLNSNKLSFTYSF